MDSKDGYDYARKIINPVHNYLSEPQPFAKLSPDLRVEQLLITTQKFSSLFKQGIVQFIEDWWRLQESNSRNIPCPPQNPSPCTQCGQPLSFDDELKAKHYDTHYRTNKIIAFLKQEGEFEMSIKKKKLIKPTLNDRKRKALFLMLKEPLHDKTRERIMEQLYPDLKKSVTVSSHSYNTWIKEGSSSAVSRGWYRPTKAWTTAPIASVPCDVLQYGTMLLPNGDGLWLHLFAKQLAQNLPISWVVWLHPSSSYNTITHKSLNGTKNNVPGSKLFMQLLTEKERCTLIRAEDRYDDSLCALCGDKFQVVLSEDPTDSLGEDFVFFDAIRSPKSTFDMYHKKCYAEVFFKPVNKNNLLTNADPLAKKPKLPKTKPLNNTTLATKPSGVEPTAGKPSTKIKQSLATKPKLPKLPTTKLLGNTNLTTKPSGVKRTITKSPTQIKPKLLGLKPLPTTPKLPKTKMPNNIKPVSKLLPKPIATPSTIKSPMSKPINNKQPKHATLKLHLEKHKPRPSLQLNAKLCIKKGSKTRKMVDGDLITQTKRQKVSV